MRVRVVPINLGHCFPERVAGGTVAVGSRPSPRLPWQSFSAALKARPLPAVQNAQLELPSRLQLEPALRLVVAAFTLQLLVGGMPASFGLWLCGFES